MFINYIVLYAGCAPLGTANACGLVQCFVRLLQCCVLVPNYAGSCVVLCPAQELLAEKEQMETKHDDELQELKERHGQEFHEMGENSHCSPSC